MEDPRTGLTEWEKGQGENKSWEKGKRKKKKEKGERTGVKS